MDQISAACVLPALEGEVSVTSITAGSAAAAINPGVTTQRYYDIGVDDGAGVAVAFYMTRASNAAPTAPAPTATTGGGRTRLYEARTHQLVLHPGDQVRVYAIGTGTHYVRISPSSPA